MQTTLIVTKTKDQILTTFTELGLSAPLLKALSEKGYEQPTPIQERAIPKVLAKHDLLGIAQTGTGKTAAFALPILHRLAQHTRRAPRRGCRALILSPTRELATQIGESFRTYGRHQGVSVAVVFGGVPARPQIKALSKGVDVLVATPGRLLDHIDERHADISSTEIFVLDEADQMLDLGFFKPIRRVVSHLTHRRQNLFFSATMPDEISGLAGELLNDPVQVSVTPVATTAERVAQRVVFVEPPKKRALLTELLGDEQMERTLVFARTKRGADRIAQHLDREGISASAIHGNKSQRQRENALSDFRRSRTRVLVATDIAARGIDINLVTHVVNFELPEVPEAYVHRIGRTARAGASGIAISFCADDERGLLRAIERTTRQKIPHEDRRGDETLKATQRRKPSNAEGQASDPGNGQEPSSTKPNRIRRPNDRPRPARRNEHAKSERHLPHRGKRPHIGKTNPGNDRTSDTRNDEHVENGKPNARRPAARSHASAGKHGEKRPWRENRTDAKRGLRKENGARPEHREREETKPRKDKKPISASAKRSFSAKKTDRSPANAIGKKRTNSSQKTHRGAEGFQPRRKRRHEGQNWQLETID